MAKGFKLKELLSHQKEIEKAEKLENDLKKKKSQELKKEEPTIVTASNLKKLEKKEKKADVKKEVAADTEEYQSQALSKKEKRKLKKELKKMQEQDATEAQKHMSGDKDESGDDREEEEEEEGRLDLEKLAKSDSESEDDSESENDSEEDEDVVAKEESEEKEEQEEEQDVPLSDVEFDSDADVVPHHKLTVNNTKAMKHALERVQLPWEKHSFQEHQSVTSETNTDEHIKDIYDDTERELAFYKQSLDAVLVARDELKRLKVPFKRPLDYFAEMVKSDEHMDKIKGKLIEEASDKKAREEARRQRQLKKFGKQVQNATLQKRQLEKRETLEKIKSLKNKRKHNEIDHSEFNVGVEEEVEGKRFDRGRPNGKRAAKNAKYGQGGMKRFKRKNDATSSADVSGFSSRKMKGKTNRPGKSRRARRF
ncbi:CPA_1a_G0032110.mRNA.1.CDS.1 [Saccharomyces cerevisiae]|nr:CPA_1a_G0032110.mRNA.1.CDS.1 [Saccharomyces cerevisiae]CAI4581557.1 BBM_1a_G0031520.mRNA.1.CDS.1 [Saccharomyces cerevisiae]CAI7193067.1 BBM_1a_G0031520.mRNA.1.CDS.1 [Saccharomyces cerevisiae]CAI7378912.1 CPA_1a_G0032110.mRNA.1.CDS.1 [Saccharomyces cerevisiae]